MLHRALCLLSAYWGCYAILEPIAITLLHITAAVVYAQNLGAIPKPTYLVHRLGEWVTIPPRGVDLEVVPFDLAFKPSATSPAEIFFITTGFILMLASFFQLLTRSRALGSSFLLPLTILCSTGVSFLFALRIAIALDILIHPTPLSYALPFLISIVGFNKPLRIAHAIFHTRLASLLYRLPQQPPLPGSPIPIVIIDSFLSVCPFIARDVFLEISVLVLASHLPIGDHRELCTLAVLTLAIHNLVISSYFVSILSVILQSCTHRIANDIKAITKSTSASFPPSDVSKPSYLSLSFLLGKKGTSLYNPTYIIESGTLKVVTDQDSKKENGKDPVSLLKLLVLTSFLLFKFIAPFSHYPINQSTAISTTNRTIVDISPPISAMLNALADANAVEPGMELYIKLYSPTPTPPISPPGSTSFFDQVSISLNSLNTNLDSLILPDNVFLSVSLLATLALNILLSASLVAFQAGVLLGLKKIILRRCKETEEKPQLPVPAEDKRK